MKSLIVVVFVSALLFLQTVTALSALKYFWQSPSGKYQNRDSIPKSIRKTVTNNNIDTIAEQKNDLQTNDFLPQQRSNSVYPSADLNQTNDFLSQQRSNSAYPSADLNQASQDQSGINNLKQYIGLVSVLASINRLSQDTTPQIDSVIAGLEPNYPTDSKVREFISDMHFLVNNRDALQLWNLMEPGLKPFEELAVSYPNIFNPVLNMVDWILYEMAEKSVPVISRILGVAQAARGDSVDRAAVSKKFKQYVQLISVGANISRLSHTDAQEIDEVLADVETKYPINTEMGNFIAGMRYMLRNRRGLRLWDLSEHNMKNLEELAAHEPNLFNPVFYAVDAIVHEMARRLSTAILRFGEATRSGRLRLPLSRE